MEAPLSTSTQATTSKGCNAGCKCGVAKNKTKLKNRESPRGGDEDIHSSTLKREEKGEELLCAMKERKNERKTGRKRELA